jgi:hypothetical protein
MTCPAEHKRRAPLSLVWAPSPYGREASGKKTRFSAKKIFDCFNAPDFAYFSGIEGLGAIMRVPSLKIQQVNIAKTT